jgi:uncharacterized protein YgbK (DUF1537 family)
MAERRKLIVLDDDPTGSQTVHSAPLLLRWDPASLRRGLRHPSPLLFVLANTRALAPAQARQRVQEICRALAPALAEAQADGVLDRWLILSRGDSTLRGHFPLELEVIERELGPFDATLLAPAFLPGGRTTVDGVHLLDGVPVHQSAFARDRLFGFSTSHLPSWVEQKTGGAIAADAVQQIGLAELDAAAADPGGPGQAALNRRLAGLCGGVLLAVDASQPQQLQALGRAVWAATDRRLLAQSAASLINGLVPLPPQPRDAAALVALRRSALGLVLVGSHVPLADAQLQELLLEPACVGVELVVSREPQLVARQELPLRQRLQELLAAGLTPVLFTSRGELACASDQERLQLGLELARLMARLAAALAPDLGFILSKGGVTSHVLLEEGLDLSWVELQGQLFAGLSLVLTPPEAVVPALPVITFPGNLGDAGSLRQAWRLMQGSDSAAAAPAPEHR